jgi:hypothetical protein
VGQSFSVINLDENSPTLLAQVFAAIDAGKKLAVPMQASSVVSLSPAWISALRGVVGAHEGQSTGRATRISLRTEPRRYF